MIHPLDTISITTINVCTIQVFLIHLNIHNTIHKPFCSWGNLDYKHLNQIMCYNDEQPCSIQHAWCPFPSVHIILPVSSCCMGQNRFIDANLYHGHLGLDTFSHWALTATRNLLRAKPHHHALHTTGRIVTSGWLQVWLSLLVHV